MGWLVMGVRTRASRTGHSTEGRLIDHSVLISACVNAGRGI